MQKELHRRAAEYLAQGKFVATLGGEHSISYAPIKAHAEKFPGLSVLQIDAHADLQEAYEGNPWSHASVMARVREIPQISSITAVGIRSMSEEEAEVVDKKRTFFGHDLDLEGKWIDKVIEQLSDQVYITFDLDGFDSSLMPSTGTPEPGGLSWNQAMALLKMVAEKKKIIGLDVVELCPNSTNIAPDYLAAKLVYKIPQLQLSLSRKIMNFIQSFMKRNYKHFNAAVCVDAAEGWIAHLNQGGKMLITLAGAMSTAELGISLAELIRQDKVHAISCTGANLEEDIFNLVAHTHYERVPHYRYLTAEDEVELLKKGMNSRHRYLHPRRYCHPTH